MFLGQLRFAPNAQQLPFLKARKRFTAAGLFHFDHPSL
jgi:hypothetical protein